jgi:hypothetical protein
MLYLGSKHPRIGGPIEISHFLPPLPNGSHVVSFVEKPALVESSHCEIKHFKMYIFKVSTKNYWKWSSCRVSAIFFIIFGSNITS